MSDTLFPNGQPDFLDDRDLAARHLNGDEWLVIRPMITSMRLAVMTADDASVEHWCFNTPTQAVAAWSLYPHIPAWWTRHWHRDNTVSYPDAIDCQGTLV